MNGSDGRLANTEASKDCAVWRTRGGSWKVGRKMSSTDLGVVWTQLILYWAVYNTILYCKGKHTVVINSLWITMLFYKEGSGDNVQEHEVRYSYILPAGQCCQRALLAASGTPETKPPPHPWVIWSVKLYHVLCNTICGSPSKNQTLFCTTELR